MIVRPFRRFRILYGVIISKYAPAIICGVSWRFTGSISHTLNLYRPYWQQAFLRGIMAIYRRVCCTILPGSMRFICVPFYGCIMPGCIPVHNAARSAVYACILSVKRIGLHNQGGTIPEAITALFDHLQALLLYCVAYNCARFRLA
jgi:hypothetical protein